MKDFLAVASYPQISSEDQQWIQTYRKDHDIYFDLIPPHFSLVFPTYGFQPESFIQEIRKQARDQPSIEFEIRCAIRNNDLTNDYWHVLLVPDQGFGQMVKLHNRLYQGLLSHTERLDIDFIPHLAIGNTKDPQECKAMVEGINAQDIDIKGVIHTIDVLAYKNQKLSTIQVIPLVSKV